MVLLEKKKMVTCITDLHAPHACFLGGVCVLCGFNGSVRAFQAICLI